MPNPFRAALAVFFPVACAGCARADVTVCGSCRHELTPTLSRQELIDGTPVWAGAPYRGVLRNVLLQFKENNRTDVAVFLAPLLSAAIVSAERDAARGEGNSRAEAIQLVCVPSSGAAWRRRGYSPIELLAKRAGFVCRPALRSAAGGRVQKSLTAGERLTNRRGAFRARRVLAGRQCILIDDILTTGATLRAAIWAIQQAGGVVVGVAVVAFTPRNH